MNKKRFFHKKWHNERELFDNNKSFAIVDTYIQADKICNKLNELNDCIKLLKQQKKLKKDVMHWEQVASYNYERYIELLKQQEKLDKENKQLKSILKEMVKVSEYNGAITPTRVKSMTYNFIGDLND